MLGWEIIQFSYLTGNKREWQHSSEFADIEKPPFKTIDVYAFKYAEGEDMVKFKPGHLPMGNYMCTMNDTF